MTSQNERIANKFQRLIDGNPSTVSGKTNSPVKNKSHAKSNSIQNSPDYSTYNYDIQPITTQTKFTKDKNIQNETKNSDGDLLKNYMGKKVAQLKKQKQNSKKNIQQNTGKANNLRKIVQDQQNNNNQKQKAKKTLITNNQTGTNNNQKNKNQKRFTNSHSQMKKDGLQNKDKNRTGISVEINKKLPSLTPQIKPQKNLPSDKQVSSENNKQTPSSKNSFRIKKTVNNVSSSPPQPMDNATLAKIKKLREQFIRLNQNQKEIQKEILQNHLSTKDKIEKIKIKYRLNFNNYEKYGIKMNPGHNSQKMQQSIITKKPSKKLLESSTKQIPQIKHNNEDSPLKVQRTETQSLYEQIQKINNLLKNKQKSLKKSQLKLQKNPYLQFLRQQPSDIQQEFQEEEIDSPKQQPLQTVSQKIMGNTYGSVMSQMKTKKWGLQQRITFQTHRQKSVDSSKITKQSLSKFDNKGRSPINPILQQSQTKETEDTGNKISVNSRLKNILFQ